MARKVELLVALKGDRELWPAGTLFDYDKMPGEIASEIAMDRGTVRVFEKVEAPAVPPPAPPVEEPSFSDVAKEILEEALKEKEEEVEVPVYAAKHRGGGRWVVLEIGTGERMNEKYLKKAEAHALAKKLNEGEEEKPTLVLREDSE